MAKLSTATYLDLTSVQKEDSTARYDFNNRRGDLPLAGELVEVTGFENPANNVMAFLVFITPFSPGYFTVGRTTQSDETHDASAVIRAGRTCVRAPKPTRKQALQLGKVKSTCTFHAKHPRPKRGTKSSVLYWTPIMRMSVFHLTKQNLRLIARHWKRSLTTAERAIWNSWAAGATMYSYDGKTHTPTGFQAYVRVVKSQNFLYFSPYDVHGNPWTVIFPNPPSTPWSDLGPPDISIRDRFDDGWIGVKFANIPQSPDLYALLNVARPGTNPSRPHSWFAGWNASASVSWLNPDFYSFYRTDFPLLPPTTNTPMVCSLSYYDATTYSWGDYAYFYV
jgi:hypothetical protein